jgi:hypothetical protein
MLVAGGGFDHGRGDVGERNPVKQWFLQRKVVVLVERVGPCLVVDR